MLCLQAQVARTGNKQQAATTRITEFQRRPRFSPVLPVSIVPIDDLVLPSLGPLFNRPRCSLGPILPIRNHCVAIRSIFDTAPSPAGADGALLRVNVPSRFRIPRHNKQVPAVVTIGQLARFSIIPRTVMPRAEKSITRAQGSVCKGRWIPVMLCVVLLKPCRDWRANVT